MNLIPLRLSIFLHKEHVNVRCAKSTSLAINTWNDLIHKRTTYSVALSAMHFSEVNCRKGNRVSGPFVN